MSIEKVIKNIILNENVEPETKRTLQSFAKQAQVFLDAGLKLDELWKDLDLIDDENYEPDNELAEDYPFEQEFDDLFGGPGSGVNKWVAAIKKYVASVK